MAFMFRYAYPWWREKEIVSELKRLKGLCPLTPEETTLVLKALGYGNETRIYIASGEIYGSERRLRDLHNMFPLIVRFIYLVSILFRNSCFILVIVNFTFQAVRKKDHLIVYFS